MRRNVISSFGIFILFVGTFLPQTESIPSIWSNVVVPRARRQTLSLTTDAATENATPSIEDGTQPEKSATDEKVNCDMLVEQIRPICKEESCPIDDETVDKCCECLQTCCSSEQNSSSSSSMNMEIDTNSTRNAITTTPSATDVKKQIKDAAGKVQGFFKDVGQNIKQGVSSGWDKVKTTANTVKESVRKGINSGANWVKNHTDGSNKDMCKDNNTCTTFGDSDNMSSTVDEEDGTKITTDNPSMPKRRRDVQQESSDLIAASAPRLSKNNFINERKTLKKKRDVPPGMMAMRNKKHGEIETMASTTMPEMTSESHKRSMRSAGDAESKVERHKRAGPPSNSQNMRTTTSPPPQNESRERRRRDKKHGQDSNELSPSNSAASENEDSTIKPNSGKVGIRNQSTNSDDVDIPIRAPGSVNIDFSLNISNKSIQSPHSNLSSPDESQPQVSLPTLNPDQSKPGRCRPLSQGLQCVPLGKDDAAQCKQDSVCEGTKKCCFYSCKPNTDIGICEHPIFS